MPQILRFRCRPPRLLVLGYSGLLAAIAGFINSVALLVLAFPVGNLTALTTQLGMDSANPLLYESCMIAFIVLGFLFGAAAAGATLGGTQANTGPRHAAVLLGEAVLLLAATAAGLAGVQALLAAAACGLQNGMTSNFRGMTLRTTHFTGTMTDLGFMLGRSRRHGLDTWKATVLTTTVVLFLGGGAAGAVIGGRIGEHALILPAAACLALAPVSLLHARRRQSAAARVSSPPAPAYTASR